MTTLPLAELLRLVDGSLLAGPGDASISGVAALAEAEHGDATFFGNPKYVSALRRTQASLVLVPRGFPPTALTADGGAPRPLPSLVEVDSPSLAFTKLVAHFSPPPATHAPGIAPTAVIAPGAQLGAGVSIQPYAVIEDGAVIGDNTFLGAHVFIGAGAEVGADSRVYPHVTIREHSRIGKRVIIHSGAVIGSDGYGFELQDGRHVKIPQTGIVQIDDDVEIGANVTIDRARFGRTHIGEGTKIDNLVQIGHNVVVGPHCLLVSQSGISGSTRLGRYVTLAGQVGVVGHVQIGDQAIIGAKTGISRDVPAKAVYFGNVGEPIDRAKENLAYYRRLPKLNERVKKLEEQLAALKAAMESAQVIERK